MATDRLRAWQLLLVDSFPATPRRSALYFVKSGSDHVCKAVGPDGTVYTATGGGGGTLEEWHTGSGAPSGGNDGDLYLDTSSGDVYEKAGGSWSVVCNITGPAGTNGTNGTNGDPGSVWRDGTGAPSGGLGIDGDYYLDDATGDVYLKAAGSYSVVANIKGATGAAGAAGTNGAPGPNEVTTATDTDLTGILKGNGTKVGTATAGTDYVAPGGALGTPSSGTLTNCTGLPAAGVTGLGDAATKNVGTGSGTVAAGDHTHTAADVGAVPTSRTINGVDLSADRSLADFGLYPKAWRGRIFGLTLSNNTTDATNDIDIAVGNAWDNTNDVLLDLTSGLTKRLDASWAVGTNQGGLDTGSKANSTWYHVWLIRRSDTGVVDVLFSTSASSPTMPSNYDQKRRIGSIYVQSSGVILPFKQRGDMFRHDNVSLLSGSTPPTSATLLTVLSPLGVECRVRLFAGLVSTSGVKEYWIWGAGGTTNVDYGDSMSVASGTAIVDRVEDWIWTDTSSRVYHAANSASNIAVFVGSRGWIDRRGQDG